MVSNFASICSIFHGSWSIFVQGDRSYHLQYGFLSSFVKVMTVGPWHGSKTACLHVRTSFCFMAHAVELYNCDKVFYYNLMLSIICHAYLHLPLSWKRTVGLHVKAICCFIVHEVELCNCAFHNVVLSI